MPAKFFKDFNKDTKDLLTKQYIPAGDWKMESKIKPADRTFIINPGFEAKGGKTKLSVDVDYNVKEYSVETKTTFTNDGNIKPKLTWKNSWAKVEFTLNKLAIDTDFELVDEITYGDAALYGKFTKAAGEVSAAYAVCTPATIGAGVKFGLNGALKGWSAGVRATHDGYIVNVTTEALKTYTTGVFAPVKIAGQSVKLAAQVDCGNKDKFDVAVGFEVPVSDFTLKVKTNKNFNTTVALVRKFAEKWTAAASFSLDSVPSFGLTLTRE